MIQMIQKYHFERGIFVKSVKKATACLLSLLLLFSVSSAAFAAAPADLDKTGAISSGGVIDASLPVPAWAIPEGYHLTGLRHTDANGMTWYYAETDPSVYGLTLFKWIAADGREASPAETPNAVYNAAAGLTTDFPATWDARTLGLITPVEYQIGGTCWAHAAAAVMEANAIKKGLVTNDSVNLSEYHIVWNGLNGYTENVTDARNDGIEDPNADILDHGGNYIYAGFAVLNHEGPALESRFGLNESLDKLSFFEQMQSTFGFRNRFDRDLSVTAVHTFDKTPAAIKAAITSFGAAQLSYGSYDQYYNYQWNGDGTTPCTYYCPVVSAATNHAVTVVGWDDTFSRENFVNKPAHDGAWLIKNSWSARWGSDGYFWLSYDDPTIDQVCAYEVESLSDRQNAYSYNGLVCEDSLSCTAAANVFTAKKREYLTYVTLGRAITGAYTCKIYGDLPANAADPTAGTLLGTVSGTATGESWIPVPDVIDLDAGERFAVVFEGLSNAPVEGSVVPNRVAITAPVHYSSNAGESFVLQSGVWKDVHTLGKHNAGVGAVTRDKGDPPYSVTFSCPGYHEFTVLANMDGTVALPETAGHTWVLTWQGQPFTGTGVTRNITVTAHCYPTNGAVNPDTACETEYKCVYCGEKMLPSVETHQFDAHVVAATREHPGYTEKLCAVCGKSVVEDYTIHPDGDGGVLGDFIWQYYDGAIAFAGTGATPDFDGQNAARPWDAHKNETVDLFIGEGLTKLGAWSFCYFSKLKNISFPASLATASANAFFRCYGLEEVHLPATITTVGDGLYNAMYSFCNGVKRLVIDEGVRTLNNNVLTCDTDGALEEVVIPSTLQSITYAFFWYYHAPLKRYEVSPDNPAFKEVDGVLYSKDGLRLVNYPPSKPGVYFSVPAGVYALGVHAFSDMRQLRYLDFTGTSMTGLSQCAFHNTTSLSNINLPTNLRSLTKQTFITNSAALKSVFIPSTLTSAHENAFQINKPLTLYTDTEVAALGALTNSNLTVTVLPGHVHDFSTLAYEEPATCSAEGFIIRTCMCGQFAYEPVPANGQHHKTNPVVHEPTCTEDGYTAYTCDLCGTAFTDDVVPATGHDWQWIEDAPATCGDNGRKHEECAVCHTRRNENTVIPATGNHNWQWITDDPATCGDNGRKHEECSVCHAKRNENTVIPATGNHNWQWITDDPATCGRDGRKHEECSVCHAERNENTVIPATGNHNWQWITDDPATCGRDGRKHEVCLVCRTTRNENTVIPATGNHVFTDQIVNETTLAHDATCTEAAAYYYTCAVCEVVEHNDAHVFTVGQPNGHSFTWVEDKSPTCGEDGRKHEECSVCHVKRNENTGIPATGNHSWQWITDEAATCGKDGKKHEECSVCHVKRNENTGIPATGNHSFTKKDANASTLIHEATCAAAATYRYTCAVCGKVEQNAGHTFTVGSALGHSYQLTGETGATCAKQGEKVYTCARCGDVKREATPKTAHTYGDWYTETAPTCTATGKLVRVCAVCGDRQTQTLNKTAHTDNDGDGYCDVCHTETASHANKCPYCGQEHTGFFGAIVRFFHRIAYFFKNLFR